MDKKVLHLTLHKKWFDEILNGTKKIEYRDVKPYWTKRLFKNGKPKKFDEILFRNGYGKKVPKMKVEFLGIKVKDNKYNILLGKVIK
tara:strand:+ start:821 stop:1081 length:261 start_codon:yes stop_codon:yes gene_type:complete